MTDRTHISSSVSELRELTPNSEANGLQTKYRLVVLLGSIALLFGVGRQLLALEPIIAGGLAVSIGIIGWFLPGEYAFASGHIGVGIALPSEPSVVILALLELSLWALLILESESWQSALRLGTLGSGIAGLLAVVGWAVLYQTASLWTVSLGSAAVIGLALYTVHRYEIVQLGLVAEAEQ